MVSNSSTNLYKILIQIKIMEQAYLIVTSAIMG